MRRLLIAGNWKMHMTAGETEHFFKDFLPPFSEELLKGALAKGHIEVAFFPAFTSLYVASFAMEGAPKGFSLGAQNVHWEAKGAFTGEISPSMVAESGCRYCLVGHSERRHLFGETDEMTQRKIRALHEVSLKPVFCVGETLEEREKGKTFPVVERQLLAGFDGVPSEKLSLETVVAYEPVWAIGTGKTASESDAQEACHYLRAVVARHFGKDAADGIRILYGGSVKPENTAKLLAMDDIDGVLVGGATLKSGSFLDIVKAAVTTLGA